MRSVESVQSLLPLFPLPRQPQGQFSIHIFPMSFFFLPDLNDDGDGAANDSDRKLKLTEHPSTAQDA